MDFVTEAEMLDNTCNSLPLLSKLFRTNLLVLREAVWVFFDAPTPVHAMPNVHKRNRKPIKLRKIEIDANVLESRQDTANARNF